MRLFYKMRNYSTSTNSTKCGIIFLLLWVQRPGLNSQGFCSLWGQLVRPFPIPGFVRVVRFGVDAEGLREVGDGFARFFAKHAQAGCQATLIGAGVRFLAFSSHGAALVRVAHLRPCLTHLPPLLSLSTVPTSSSDTA